MTHHTSADVIAPPDTARPQTLAGRRPVATFALLALAIGLPTVTVPSVSDAPAEPFLLAFLFLPPQHVLCPEQFEWLRSSSGLHDSLHGLKAYRI